MTAALILVVHACRLGTPPAGAVFKRANVQLCAEIELASTLFKFVLDALALMFVLLAAFVLALLVAIPNALAGRTLFEGVAFLSARRTELLGSGGPIFRGGFGIVILPFCRFAWRNRVELLGSRQCSFLFG